MEWYKGLSCRAQCKVRRFLKRKGFGQGSVKDRLISYTLKSRAEYAILPAADFLGQGMEGHINTPGTVGSPNWEWRMPEFERIQKELQKYKTMLMFR